MAIIKKTLDINIEQKQSHEINCLTQIFALLIHCTRLENELKRSHGAALTRYYTLGGM